MISQFWRSYHCGGEKHLSLALAPLEVVDLVNFEVLRVVGEQAGLRWLLLCKTELSVDVQWVISSAWRPNNGFDSIFVRDKVIVTVFTFPCGLCLEL